MTGVREMRAVSGLTQEDFAQHRGVSARVVKALELGQGNPTVATLNRIGAIFGLEVGFVPIRREQAGKQADAYDVKLPGLSAADYFRLKAEVEDAMQRMGAYFAAQKALPNPPSEK